jgi:transaldolase
MSKLDELKRHTLVVADTGDFASMRAYKPQDATTNPSLLAAAAVMPEYAELFDRVIGEAKANANGADDKTIVNRAMDELAVAFGLEILKIVPGRVSTEVDARLSFDTQATIDKAHHLIALYEKAGIGKDRVLIKIASTWEGIRAAETLEKEGIHCNLTLLFGIHQAVACAEAKVTLISPFVGRILDFYAKKTGKTFVGAEDPGVISVTKIYEYYKHHGYETQVMGASFRNVGEILELAGCDLLTISPKLLGELEKAEGDVPRKLDPAAAKSAKVERIAHDEATFRKLHDADEMSKAKLQEGIDGFSKAIVELEGKITSVLSGTPAPGAGATS